MTSVRKLVSQRRCGFLCRHLVDYTVTGLSLTCILQNLHYREHLLCCLESTKHDYIGCAAAEENTDWESIGWCEDEARFKSKGEQYPLFKNNWPVDLAAWVSECFLRHTKVSSNKHSVQAGCGREAKYKGGRRSKLRAHLSPTEVMAYLILAL